jgi:ubiquinone biosynthesis protein
MRQFIVKWFSDTVALMLTILLLPMVDLAYTFPLAPLYRAVGWTTYESQPAWFHRLFLFAILGFIYALIDKFIKPVLIVITGRLILATMGIWLVIVNVLVFFLLFWVAPLQWHIATPPWLWITLGGVLFTVISILMDVILGSEQPRPISEQENLRYWRIVERFAFGRRNALVESIRIKQVYDILISFGLRILVGRTFLVGVRDRVYRIMYGKPDPLAHESTPEQVRVMLEYLGPTWVKFGQMAASQADSLPEEWRVQLSLLQSDATPFPWKEAADVITRELGRPPAELFTRIDETPLAAASTAQVHRAVVNGAEPVVVKVQRPNIIAKTNADIAIMQDVSRILANRFAWARQANLDGMMFEFTEGIYRELDYRNESYHTRRLADNMEGVPGVAVPRIYGQLSTRRIITEELVSGVKPTNIEAIRAAGLDPTLLARNFVRAVVKQILFDGFFHGDPHPGNLMVNLQTGEITFIDLGLVGRLDQKDRIAILELLFVISQKSPKGLADVMERLAVKTRAYDREDFKAAVVELGYQYLLYPPSSFDLGGFMGQLTGVLGRFNMKLPGSLTLAIKAIVQAQQTVGTLDPTANLVQMGLDESKSLVHGQFSNEALEEKIKDQLYNIGRELLRRLPDLEKATWSWLDQYQKGKVIVNVDTSDLSNRLDTFSVSVRGLTVALVIAGMIIGSAIAASSFSALKGSSWWFLAPLGVIVFIAALVYGAFTAWRMMTDIRRMQEDGPYQGYDS